jgi:hypothetical protein
MNGKTVTRNQVAQTNREVVQIGQTFLLETRMMKLAC